MPGLNRFVRRLADTALSLKTFRIITTKKFNESFAHFATKVENFARIGAADERAYFDCALLRIGHLQSTHLFVPLWIILNKALQFLAQFANGRLIIEVKQNRAKQVSRNAAPVLKRLFDKVGDG